MFMTSTGDEELDRFLWEIVARVEQDFPGRVHAYYLSGSHATGTAGPTSDIDVDIVLKGSVADVEERRRIKYAVEEVGVTRSRDVGVSVMVEGNIPALARPHLQVDRTLFLYSEDMRDKVSQPTIQEHTHELMHALYLLERPFTDPFDSVAPFHYPDPNGEFYGYDQGRQVRGKDGMLQNGTRDLVTGIGWQATALIGRSAHAFVHDKSSVPRQYRLFIDDVWSPFIDDVFVLFRNEWSYLIPKDIQDRQRLRALCARVLDFENYYARLYRAVLLSALRGDDDGERLAALRTLGRRPYPDVEVMDATRLIAFTMGEGKDAG